MLDQINFFFTWKQGYVFFYVCVCRSLTNGFKEWNKKAAHIFEYRGQNQRAKSDQIFIWLGQCDQIG